MDPFAWKPPLDTSIPVREPTMGLFDDGSDGADFSDVSGGSSTADLGSDDSYGTNSDGSNYASGSYGSSLANYGSMLGGSAGGLLSGTGSGASLTSPSGRKTSRGRYISGGAVYRHSMNPLNPKALRRAISRVYRFETFAKKVLKITSPHHHVAGVKRHRRKRSGRW